MVAGAYSPFLSSYFTSVGLSATETGVLLTVMPLAVIFVQPFWARLSDKTGKRKLVLCLLIVASGVAALLYYLGSKYSVVLFATIVFALFFSALLPLNDALVIEGCAQQGVEFARVRMGGTTGYAFVVFVVGMFLDEYPEMQFIMVSLLCLVFLAAVINLPVLSGRASDKLHAEASEAVSSREPAASSTMSTPSASQHGVLGIFQTREILFVLAFAFVSQMGLGFSGSFLGRYVVELGHGQGLVGVLSAVSALSELPILLFADAIVRRFGEMRLLIASCFFMVVRIVLIGTGVVPAMVAGQLMQSITYMTVYYSCTRYVAQNVLPGRQSQGQSVLVMVQSGIAMLVANLVGGTMGDALGMRASFFASAAMTLAGTLVVLAAYRSHRLRALRIEGHTGSSQPNAK